MTSAGSCAPRDDSPKNDAPAQAEPAQAEPAQAEPARAQAAAQAAAAQAAAAQAAAAQAAAAQAAAAHAAATSCVQPGCEAQREPDAPVALCSAHLAASAEWAGETSGVVEPLPSPCVACGSRLGVTYRSGRLCAVCEWRYGDVPDGELAAPRVDVVYYLRFADRIKIGTTSNPRQRFGQLRFDELLAFERGDRGVERRRHEQFAAVRLGGEWFAADPALVTHVESIAAGHPDPWAVYARWRSEALALRVS
jgi:hypothetical protein